jgi:hypothetical protein
MRANNVLTLNYIHNLVTANPTQTSFLLGISGTNIVSYTGATLKTNLATYKAIKKKNQGRPAVLIGTTVWKLESARSTVLNNILWLVTKKV